MDAADIPECPVCLQSFDGDYTIPRVLACGHTTCESCLKSIPQKFPETIRCPACTQLVKFPSQGPSSLPKNIDLLRLITSSSKPQKHSKKSQNALPDFHQQYDSVSRLWSDDFYSKWKNWVLPENGVLVQPQEKRVGILKEGNKEMRLFMVADGLLPIRSSGSAFKLNYVARVMNFLYGMKETAREELNLILKICSKHSRICKAYGLWAHLEDGFLYLVCEKLNGTILEQLPRFGKGLGKYFLSSFAMMGMEMCEAVIALHLENSTLGCLSLSCFALDDLGHVNLTLSEVLLTGRTVHEAVMEAGSKGSRLGEKEMGTLVSDFFKRETFVSPEVLFQILKKEGLEIECGSFKCSVVHSSDVWSLACVMLRLLIGKIFIEELVNYVAQFISEMAQENGSDCSGLYIGLVEKARSLLGSKLGEKCEPLQQILCRCLNFDPGNRPLVIEVWRCVRELIFGLEFDAMLRLDDSIREKNIGHNLVLGELTLMSKSISNIHNKDEMQRAQSTTGENLGQNEKMGINEDFVEGLLDGNVKVKDMKGHLHCVTGLAVGGGFLFSSSFDKSVHLWSLEDFSHVHTFKGHEHKVMAVIYVGEEQPLCISGDSGGGIFLWSITTPLRQEPLKEWYEEKDWRYSGIHALTTAGNGYLYTGSGDRSVKAWSLQDGILLCTMDGHKSLVSTLTACDQVLYSGSWDGTIRLWSLSDHSPLTVLGDNIAGTVTCVLSRIIHQNMLVAAYENGQIKIWRNDVFMKSMKAHKGAVFAIGLEGRYLFTGGWDNCVCVQELSGDDFDVEVRSIGSIPGGSVVTCLLYWEGKLFVGYGDRTVKVYYYGK